jgi:hypothetical protein
MVGELFDCRVVEKERARWEARMTRVYVLCEGQTEEMFVKEVLAPHFFNRGLFLNPILLSPSGKSSRRKDKGGVIAYEPVRQQILQLSREDSSAYVTTMIDLYALPERFPGKESTKVGIDKARAIEKAMAEDIGQRNCIPYISLHEFEAMLFCDLEMFLSVPDFEEGSVNKLSEMVGDSAPEEINEHPDTAPSKRIIKVFGERYQKVLHGTDIAKSIGLPTIREKCPHFDNAPRKL